MEFCPVPCLNCCREFSLSGKLYLGLNNHNFECTCLAIDGGRLPLVLSCECSSICVDCVNQEHKRRRTSVVCPKCNKATPLDRRKVTEQLPPNFFLLGLLTAEVKGLIR